MTIKYEIFFMAWDSVRFFLGSAGGPHACETSWYTEDVDCIPAHIVICHINHINTTVIFLKFIPTERAMETESIQP